MLYETRMRCLLMVEEPKYVRIVRIKTSKFNVCKRQRFLGIVYSTGMISTASNCYLSCSIAYSCMYLCIMCNMDIIIYSVLNQT